MTKKTTATTAPITATTATTVPNTPTLSPQEIAQLIDSLYNITLNYPTTTNDAIPTYQMLLDIFPEIALGKPWRLEISEMCMDLIIALNRYGSGSVSLEKVRETALDLGRSLLYSFPDLAALTPATPTAKDPLAGIKTVVVIAREWFDARNGNSYHTVSVYLDGRRVEVECPVTYGYGSAFLDTAAEIIGCKNRDVLYIRSQTDDPGILLQTEKISVGRKKDL